MANSMKVLVAFILIQFVRAGRWLLGMEALWLYCTRCGGTMPLDIASMMAHSERHRREEELEA